MEKRLTSSMRKEFESLHTRNLEDARKDTLIPQFKSPLISTQPAIQRAMSAVLHRAFTGFTSPHQAELINSTGSSHHVIGVLPTGGGKSLAFLAAPQLFPNDLFIVVSPLVALTNDLHRRLTETGNRGGVYGAPGFVFADAQIVLVSAHHAATDAFHQMLSSNDGVRRCKRIFIDEAHKIATDKDFRPCFRRFDQLIRSGVPVTLLSGSLMPRSVPYILQALRIPDTKQVTQIRRSTARANLKYVLKRIRELEALKEIQGLVKNASATFTQEDRGIIFVKTYEEAEAVSAALDCPMYHGALAPDVKEAAAQRWRLGVTQKDRWMVATGAFGHGVDYAHVRCVIHLQPQENTSFYQEGGRGGRDGRPAVCHILWHTLPAPLSDLTDVDHSGRMEMRQLLVTEECIRLSFAAFDGEAHSCIALGGEICSNCEKLDEVSWVLALAPTMTLD